MILERLYLALKPWGMATLVWLAWSKGDPLRRSLAAGEHYHEDEAIIASWAEQGWDDDAQRWVTMDEQRDAA